MCEVVTRLKTKRNVLDSGKVRYILGVNFEEIENKYCLHQSTYIEKLMVKFEDLPRTYVNLPLKVGIVPPREEKEIIENVFNTKEYKLNLSNIKGTGLVSYSDASWGSNLMQRHSTSGYIPISQMDYKRLLSSHIFIR